MGNAVLEYIEPIKGCGHYNVGYAYRVQVNRLLGAVVESTHESFIPQIKGEDSQIK